MSRGDAERMMDSIRRGISNMRQSETICEQAATAFRMERSALEESQMLLESLMDPEAMRTQAALMLLQRQDMDRRARRL